LAAVAFQGAGLAAQILLPVRPSKINPLGDIHVRALADHEQRAMQPRDPLHRGGKIRQQQYVRVCVAEQVVPGMLFCLSKQIVDQRSTGIVARDCGDMLQPNSRATSGVPSSSPNRMISGLMLSRDQL